MRQERFGSSLKHCVMLFARRKAYVRRARSMSAEQNQHTRSRSVVLNEEGKRRYNLLVSALAGSE
jgi:hypothetical protein